MCEKKSFSLKSLVMNIFTRFLDLHSNMGYICLLPFELVKVLSLPKNPVKMEAKSFLLSSKRVNKVIELAILKCKFSSLTII